MTMTLALSAPFDGGGHFDVAEALAWMRSAGIAPASAGPIRQPADRDEG
jgi:hypothetical protein